MFDPKKVKPEQWAHALYMALSASFDAPTLLDVVREGEDKFIKACESTNQLKLSRSHYKVVFRKLRKRAKHMGLDPRVMNHG